MGNLAQAGDQFAQQLKSLGGKRRGRGGEPGYIPARTRHAVAQTGRDRIDRDGEDDGDIVRRRDQDLGGRGACADQNVRLCRHEFPRQRRQPAEIAVRRAQFVGDIASLDITDPRQFGGDGKVFCIDGASDDKNADACHALLRACRNRTRKSGTGEQAHELASSHFPSPKISTDRSRPPVQTIEARLAKTYTHAARCGGPPSPSRGCEASCPP